MDKLMTGTIIKNARIQKGYTQKELGDILGVSNKAVSRWENGESFPDITLLDVIANTLEISIDELVTGEKNKQPSKETIKDIIRTVKIQKKENRRNNISKAILSILLFSIIILGWCTFGSYSCDIDCYNYYALFIISMMIVAVYAIKDKVSSIKSTDKVGKILFTLSVVSCIYSALLMLTTFELESMGKLNFIKPENKGPLLHYQLIFIFTVNVAITSFYL